MDFYKRLGIVCRAVPEGKVITYGQAALLCGYPKNARQVGYGLKKELAGDVPAYKVVNSQGVLSGAASFEHPDLQRMLLEEEGIEISMDNKVDHAYAKEKGHALLGYAGNEIITEMPDDEYVKEESRICSYSSPRSIGE